MKVYSPVARHTRRLIKSRLNRIEYGSLIDIGCGSGELLKELSLSPDVYLSGVDFSPTAIDQISKQIEGSFAVVDIQKGPLTTLKEDDLVGFECFVQKQRCIPDHRP